MEMPSAKKMQRSLTANNRSPDSSDSVPFTVSSERSLCLPVFQPSPHQKKHPIWQAAISDTAVSYCSPDSSPDHGLASSTWTTKPNKPEDPRQSKSDAELLTRIPFHIPSLSPFRLPMIF